MKIRYRNDEDSKRALFKEAGRLLIQRIAPLADEIHDGEGNRQNAQESYEEFEEIPVEGVDHVVYIITSSAYIYMFEIRVPYREICTPT